MRRTSLLSTIALLSASAVLASDALDERGWGQGQPAARTAEFLQPIAPEALTLPEQVSEQIERRTFLFYFSPTCGHCKATIPEVIALHAELGDEMDFLAVASSSANPVQVDAFYDEFGVPFPSVIDQNRRFARAVGARSTPTVVLVEPGEDEQLLLLQRFAPWFEGAGALMRMKLDPSDPFQAFTPGTYQGPTVCGTCHAAETESWAMSHHALAYRTLYVRERAQDEKCVGCHVTGLGEPTGFVMGDHASSLGGVGCESCHSAGGPHDGESADAAAVCEGCHDAEHSVAFSYEKGIPHIDHYLSLSLSEEEKQRRLSALRDGSLERPLLDFPEGEHLGAAACKSCHADEHKDWRRSVHAKAMGSLSTEEAGRLECVRCHSTPAGADPEPQTLDGYRIEEGVGCESCHGPGEEHAAAPRADNIIGLGESCPECVIEEICTSCHTRQWDPNWELKRRLSAVEHN